jgi:hypothetical protein
MLMAKLPVLPPDSVLNATWAPYIVSLGEVAHAWNHLQEEIGKLFCLVSGLSNSVGMSIWHSIKSDRAQRDMLEGALSARSDEQWSEKYPKGVDDIRWLLDRVNVVADQRNNAIHAPCSLGIEGDELEIIPIVFFGNPRARKLRGKDILNEFVWYKKCADTLKAFTREIESALREPHAHYPWPDRPYIPTLEPSRRHKAQCHQSDTIQARPPPRSSQA